MTRRSGNKPVTVLLPPELVAKYKHVAADTGAAVSTLIAEAMRAYLPVLGERVLAAADSAIVGDR